MGDLNNQPYMKQIKAMIKPMYYAEIQDAIQAQDEELIETLVTKYLSKKQASIYLPQVLFGLRKVSRLRGQKKKQANWTKPQILSYLKDKLDVHEFEQIWEYIENGDSDICRTVLRDLLRYEQAEEVLPHIEKLTSGVVHKKTPSQDSSFSSTCSKKTFMLAKKPINPQLEQSPPKKNENLLRQFTFTYNFRKIEEGTEKKKKQLLSKIKTQIDDDQEFTKVHQFLLNGRLKKAENIMKLYIGKKQCEKYMESLQMHFQEKGNKPLQNSILVKTNQDGMNIYEVQTQEQLENIPESEITNVLIVGMTGVGKSTYLNSLVNYFLATEMEDNFRYIVTQDMFKNGNGKSSTNKVNIYGLPKQGKMMKNIRLIDIPGLGDTGGIQKDKENLRMIKERIQKTVPSINLIIYVFKASDTRVTKQAEYVIGQIMGMFAKDMGANIIFVLTFADNDEPRVIGHLKTSFSEIIQQIEKKNQKWYVKVNNSAMFKKIDQKNHMDTCFYTMGEKCLEETANLMQTIGSVSTVNTVSVMQKRTQLETEIKGFNQIITASLIQQQEIKKMIANIENCHTKISGLNYKVKCKQQRIKYTQTDKNVTSCLNCKFACHINCAYGKNQEKIDCIAISDGFCKVCPNKCQWKSHINEHQIISREFVEVEKTIDEIYKIYQVETSNKKKSEDLLLNLITQYSTVIVNITDYCQKLNQLTHELAELELRHINYVTVQQYIDILIEGEKARMEQGFLERIRQYQKLKKEQIRLEKMLTENESKQLDRFEQTMKNRIKTLVKDEKLSDKLLKTVLDNYEKIKNYKKDMVMAQKMAEEQSPQ